MADNTQYNSEMVNYQDFFSWLVDGEKQTAVALIPENVAEQLRGIAESLTALALSLKQADHGIAAALTRHAASLTALCPGDSEIEVTDHAEHPEDRDPYAQIMKKHARKSVVTKEMLCFRTQAAAAIQDTASQGELIDDLVEVPISEVRDKLAISYWRFCSGLKCWRSPKVSKALKLICSAPVPGLHGPSYLDVFKTLVESAEWESHIYLFGGLVRDIVRRTVGNDIDIGFSATASELEAACDAAGYKCMKEGDYILIGDDASDEYLEGMVISHNGIQPPEHADFSMNTLFYDFTNDVIIDKTGIGIPAVMANRCDLPCPQERWKSWVDINGVRVCFRYYKFLLRGYDYEQKEMVYVLDTLMDIWVREPAHTIDVGRDALGGLVGCTDDKKVECLKQLVIKTYDVARKVPRRGSVMTLMKSQKLLSLSESSTKVFVSAVDWWEKGWLPLLKLSS